LIKHPEYKRIALGQSNPAAALQFPLDGRGTGPIELMEHRTQGLNHIPQLIEQGHSGPGSRDGHGSH
jgi:hypothetical protein